MIKVFNINESDRGAYEPRRIFDTLNSSNFWCLSERYDPAFRYWQVKDDGKRRPVYALKVLYDIYEGAFPGLSWNEVYADVELLLDQAPSGFSPITV